MKEIANDGDAHLKMIEIPTGKQSIDIHIAYYMGYLSGQEIPKNSQIIIVSKDRDFDKVIQFCTKTTGIQAVRRPSINGQVLNKVKSTTTNVAPPSSSVNVRKTEFNNAIVQTSSKHVLLLPL